MNEKFNFDDLIKEVNKKKEAIMAAVDDEKELPPDIEKHPEDYIDILVCRCNPQNLKKTEATLKKILKDRPTLSEYLLNQIQNVTKHNNEEKEKCNKIEDQEAQILAKSKWINKNMSLVDLVKSIMGKVSEPPEEDQE